MLSYAHMSIVNMFLNFVRVIWPTTWQPSWICTYIFSNFYRSFLGVIYWSISLKFHTQLENTILKWVTGQKLLFSHLFYFILFFLLRMHISSPSYWWYIMPFAYCNNIILIFTKMLLLRTIKYYQLVFVSRNAWEKFRRKKNVCEKKYNGENGLKRKAILCGVIPGKIKNISDRNTFYN